VRRLLAPVLFSTFLFAAAAALSSCGCDRNTVFPVDPVVYEQLQGRYGSEALPVRECEKICATHHFGATGQEGAGGDGQGGATTGTTTSSTTASATSNPAVYPAETSAMQAVTECFLTTINWQLPAVSCTGDCW